MAFCSIFFRKYIFKQTRLNLLSWLIVFLIMLFLFEVSSLGSEEPSVAVYYFHNQTGEADIEWLEENLTVSIGQTLSKIEQISYIPLSEVDSIADYHQYKAMVPKKDSMLFGQLANLLQADLIFSGNYYLEGKDQIELDLLMYLTAEGYLVEFRRISTSLENLADLKKSIIEIILQEAGINPKLISLENIIINQEINKKDEQRSGAFVSEKYFGENKLDLEANILALKYYNKAIELKDKAILEYRGADYPSKPLWNEAIQNATKAVEADPDFAEGYYLLSEIYRRTKWIIREIESLEQYIAIVKRTHKQVDENLFSGALTRLAHLKYYFNETSSAIKYFEEAISFNPNNVEARTYLMRIYYDTGQGKKALQQAEEIKRIQPDADIELDWFARRTKRISLYGKEAFDNYENGYNSYIAENYIEAIRYLEQAVSLAPAFKDAHYYLALSYYHYGDLTSAIKHWEETLKLDSFDTNARIYLNKAIEEQKYGRNAVWSFNEGYKHYVAGEYEEALVEFKKSTNLNPNFEKARTFLMRTYYHLEEMDEYLAERKRITENSNFTGEIEKEYYQLGYDFYSLGDYEVAYERLRDSLEINPDYLEARFLIAETLYQLQEYEKSNMHYQYIIDNHSNSEYYEDALLGSGWSNYLLNNYQKAEKYLETLVKNYPKSSIYQDALYKLGRVYFIQEKYQETINIYKELLQLESLEYDKEEINYLLAQSYFWIEDYDKAKELLLNIIDNNPDFKQMDEANYYYSYVLFKEEKYLEAKNLLEELVKKEDSKINVEVSYLLARTLIELKEYDRVIEINSSLLNKVIDNYLMERILFDLGLAYSRKGEDKEAIKYFNRVIDKYSQGKLAELSKIELAQSYYHLGQYQDSLDILDNVTTKEAIELKIDSAIKLGNEGLLVSLYEEFEETYPDNKLPVEDYYSLGITQFKNGEFRKAIESLRIIDQKNIDENLKKEINYWLGLSFYRLQEYEEAKDYFQKNDRLAGDDISKKSLYMLAESCYQLEEYSQAINYYSEFLQNYSTHSLAEHVYYSISWSYLNNNNYEKALSSFELLIEKFPQSKFIEESYFLKGKIEFLLSNNQNARQTLLEFIEKYPDSQYQEESLYIIAQINLEEKRWIDSILYFERLIKEYPDSRYLSGSLYGLCLSYYKKDEYNKALNVGQRYLNSFDEGIFVCDIIYITAICQEEIGNTDEAIKQYEKLISDCPESNFIDSAKEQIEFLNMQ